MLKASKELKAMSERQRGKNELAANMLLELSKKYKKFPKVG